MGLPARFHRMGEWCALGTRGLEVALPLSQRLQAVVVGDRSLLLKPNYRRCFVPASFSSPCSQLSSFNRDALLLGLGEGLLLSRRAMEKLTPVRCAFLLLLAFVALPSAQGVEKVKVELYSESLCPGCSDFIVNYLNPFFNNGLIDIVELRIVPYGNARIINGSLVCQHGPDECALNIIQTCAIRLWPKVTEWFPFIYCLEALDRSTAAKNWKSCVHPSHLDVEPLIECSASPLGAKLEMEFAAETDRLQPPHKYVPWVLVNGEPLEDNYEDVAAYVCKAYQGNKPAVCSRINYERSEHPRPDKLCTQELSLASF